MVPDYTDQTTTCSPYGYAMYASDYSYREQIALRALVAAAGECRPVEVKELARFETVFKLIWFVVILVTPPVKTNRIRDSPDGDNAK